MLHDFPDLVWLLGELPQEEGTGLGLGIAVMAGTALTFALLHRRRRPGVTLVAAARPGLVVGLAAWVALLAYMMKIGAPDHGSSADGLLPAAAPSDFAASNPGDAGPETMVEETRPPGRPGCAYPPGIDSVRARSGRASASSPRSNAGFHRAQQIARAHDIYKIYRNRNDVLAPIRQHLPPTASVVGLIEDGGDAETSLWRPYGTRRIVLLTGTNRFQRPNLEWVVVKNNVLGADPTAFAQWLKQKGGILVDQKRSQKQ